MESVNYKLKIAGRISINAEAEKPWISLAKTTWALFGSTVRKPKLRDLR